MRAKKDFNVKSSSNRRTQSTLLHETIENKAPCSMKPSKTKALQLDASVKNQCKPPPFKCKTCRPCKNISNNNNKKKRKDKILQQYKKINFLFVLFNVREPWDTFFVRSSGWVNQWIIGLPIKKRIVMKRYRFESCFKIYN